jgi:lysophospholipase L1-like esterase
MSIRTFCIYISFFIGLLGLTSCIRTKPQGKILIKVPERELSGIISQKNKNISPFTYRFWADPIGVYPEPGDLEASFQLSWNKDGLFLHFEVIDDDFSPDTNTVWNGDAIEIFLSPERGSEDICQIAVIPFSNKPVCIFYPQKLQKISNLFSGEIISSSLNLNGQKRVTDIELKFNNLQVSEKTSLAGSRFALQVYIDDADEKDPVKNKLVWYPDWDSHIYSTSMFLVELSDNSITSLPGSSRLVITDDSLVNLYVFGTREGNQISIYKNGDLIEKSKSGSHEIYFPDTFDLTSLHLNLDSDTVFVSINNDPLCLHELLLSPRRYERTREKRFQSDIRNFIYQDRQHFPKPNGTLFIGSSSIVRWETLSEDFPELSIIKRGFGGSTSPEALMYADKIALPYKPSQIIYYEGDNDIVMGLSPIEIKNYVMAFINKINSSLPETKIYILSPKPSIKRMFFWDKYEETHKLLKELEKNYSNVRYVDVSSIMFDSSGKLDKSLFVEDGIHMNSAGYSLWKNAIRMELGLPIK